MDEGDLLEPPATGDPAPWRWFLDAGTDALLAAGVAAPGAESRWLLEEASGYSADELYARLNEPASTRAVSHLRAMLARRLKGEPLQYVLGSWSFRHLDLMVDRRVLIPRPETEVVVGHALDVLDTVDHLDERRADGTSRPPVVVDLGTGSGAIALAIADERPGAEVHATDQSADALAVARANLAGLGRKGTGVRLHQGIWLTALPLGLRGEIDLLVSNPPYIADGEDLPAEVVAWEPADALYAGPTGTEALDHLVDESLGWLRPGGALVLELAPHQADELRARATRTGYADVRVAPDQAGRARALVARRPV